MKTQTGHIIKIIQLTLAAAVILSGSIWAIGEKTQEAKAYTETKIEALRVDQKTDAKEMQKDILEIKQDVTEIKTILVERFRKNK